MKTSEAAALTGVYPLRISRQSRRSFLQLASLGAADLCLDPQHLLGAPSATPSALITTSFGTLRGETSPDGIHIFRGVPFAQPPVGPLRFRPPLPPEPWTGTRDATAFAAAATQPGDIHSGEDCLYLNIWSPAKTGSHPVFVWIHGGGYTGGRASAPIFHGSSFAREGIVLVTVAYRLGVFGFMDLEPLLGPSFADSGNNAIRDLIAALHWVQGNITAFGGDPARVTVGGESAGAKAAAALMATPEARTLFHSVISESGGGERVLTHAEAATVAHSFGDAWRRDHPASSSATDIFDDLLAAPARSLIETQGRVIEASSIHFPFRPEIHTEGGRILLPARPVDLVTAGSAKGKRLLIGSNRDESALFLGPHPSADPTPQDLGNLSLARFNEVFARYTALYPDMPAYQRRIRAVTAEEYWIPSVRLADAHTHAGGTTWMYRLDFSEPTGKYATEAYHSIDLGLVWNKLDGAEQADAAAQQLAHAMHAAWCAFIRGEAPAAAGLPTWPEYHPSTRATMILSRNSHVDQQPLEAELRLWDDIL